MSSIKLSAGLCCFLRLQGSILPASSSSQGLQAFLSLWLHHSNLCLGHHVASLCLCLKSPSSYKDI